jgi:radical SAM-linked protein
MADADIDPEHYLGRLREDVALPWDHIDVGLADGFLKREWKRSLRGRLSPPCGKPVGMQVHHTNVDDAQEDQRKLVCYHCGVACDMAGMRSERVDFLVQLGALQPPVVARTDEQVAEEAILEKKRLSKRGQKRRPSRPQYVGPVYRYRVRYVKEGAEALTSHLDLIRGLARILRRASLPLRYTEGFHPKPVLSFAPALPLGTKSHSELLELELTSYLGESELIERLQEAQTESLRFIEVRHMPTGSMRLAQAIEHASYAIRLRPGPGHPPMLTDEQREQARSTVEKAIWHFVAAGSWMAPVSRQKRAISLDVRRDVVHFGLDADGQIRLVIDMSATTAYARPREVVDACLAHLGWFAAVEPSDVTRLALQCADDGVQEQAPRQSSPLVAAQP